MEAHVHVVFPQDPIADAGRHGRGAFVKAAAASGPCAVVWERHGRAEELGEFLRRALVHALQRHGEVERIEDTLRDLKTNLARRDGDADVARQVAQEAPRAPPAVAPEREADVAAARLARREGVATMDLPRRGLVEPPGVERRLGVLRVRRRKG